MIRKRSPGTHFATERTWLRKAPLRTRLLLRRNVRREFLPVRGILRYQAPNYRKSDV